MEIKLKTLKLQHFKGCAEAVYSFTGNSSTVCGDNGVGKTTVYDAYLFCLFGRTSQPCAEIMPLTKDNTVMEGVETAVEAVLAVDGKEVTLRRTLRERWETENGERGLKGIDIQRYFNGVPMQKKQFDEKLNEIADIKQWALLSSVSAFMGSKTNERREILMSLADDKEVNFTPYRSIKEAIAQGKNVDDYALELKHKKDRIDKAIDELNVKINSYKRMMVDEDFDSLKQQAAELSVKIDEIDGELQAEDGDFTKARQYRKKAEELNSQILAYRASWEEEQESARKQKRDEIYVEEDKLHQLQKEMVAEDAEQNRREKKLESLQNEFKQLAQDWQNVNAQNYKPAVVDTCPTCGQKLPAIQIEEARIKAIEAFNAEKLQRLQEIQNKAQLTKTAIATLKGEINEYNEVMRSRYQNRIANAKAAIAQKQKELNITDDITKDSEYTALRHELTALIQSKPGVDVDENASVLREEKRKIQKERDTLIRRLSKQDTNRELQHKINSKQAELKKLIDTIADISRVQDEIKTFNRKTVELKEKTVNSKFQLAKWRFTEPTLSGTIKDICTCEVDGVDYTSLNNASRINVGIDIIRTLSEHFNIYAPIFIDNRESVRTVLPTINQQISLKVTEDQEIKIINV